MPNPRRRRTKFILTRALLNVGISPALLYKETGAVVNTVIQGIKSSRLAEGRGQTADMAFVQGGTMSPLPGGINMNGAGIFVSSEGAFTDTDSTTFNHYYFGSPDVKMSETGAIAGTHALGLGKGYGNLSPQGVTSVTTLYTPNGPLNPYVSKFAAAVGFPYTQACQVGTAACSAQQTASVYLGAYFGAVEASGGLGKPYLHMSGSGRLYLHDAACAYDVMEVRNWTTGNVPRIGVIFNEAGPYTNPTITMKFRAFDPAVQLNDLIGHQFEFTAGDSFSVGSDNSPTTSSATFPSGTTALDAAYNFSKVVEATLGNDSGLFAHHPTSSQEVASWIITRVDPSGTANFPLGPWAGSVNANAAVVTIYDADNSTIHKPNIGSPRLPSTEVSAFGDWSGIYTNEGTVPPKFWMVSASMAEAGQVSQAWCAYSCSLPWSNWQGSPGTGSYSRAYLWAGSGSNGRYLGCVGNDTLTGSVPHASVIVSQLLLDCSGSAVSGTSGSAPGVCVWLTGANHAGSFFPNCNPVGLATECRNEWI